MNDAPVYRPAVPLWLGIATVTAMVINLYLIFLWAPTENTMGNVQRIFYFHVPSALLADFAFVFGGAMAIAFLKWKKPILDEFSVAGNETGLIFTLVNIVMGVMWARPVWGIWWTWDARLTSQFILVLIYIGYLMVRRGVEDPTQRANLCAVISIFGLADVPIVYLSNRLFRTQHPAPVMLGDKDSGLAPEMLFVFLFSMFSFALLLICLVRLRQRLEALKRHVHGLRMQAMHQQELQR